MSEITYYEEEIYSDWVESNNYKNYQELMTKFMQNNLRITVKIERWKELKEVKRPPYSDPDCEQLQSCSYYWEMTQFLNQREKDMAKDLKGKFEYVAPSNCKKDDGQDETVQRVKEKITMRRSGNTCESDIYLKSDQFGFSVSNFDDTHPYGILYEIARKQQDDEKREELYAFIANCINDTRTLGGWISLANRYLGW